MPKFRVYRIIDGPSECTFIRNFELERIITLYMETKTNYFSSEFILEDISADDIEPGAFCFRAKCGSSGYYNPTERTGWLRYIPH